jgi:hypothetical protein
MTCTPPAHLTCAARTSTCASLAQVPVRHPHTRPTLIDSMLALYWLLHMKVACGSSPDRGEAVTSAARPAAARL